MSDLISGSRTNRIGRQDLKLLPTPEGTATHRPIPHWQIVEVLIEALGYRHLEIQKDEYAVSPDGMRLFGCLDLELGETGITFSIGIRNSNDKSLALALTVGYRVMVCDNLCFYGDFHPVMKKHSKHLEITGVIALAVDQMQRNFAPLTKQINVWKEHELSDLKAKAIICDAFVGGALKVAKHIGTNVYEEYFNPSVPEFEPRTLWVLSNAFTSAFKKLDPIPQYQATAYLSEFLSQY